MTNLAAIPTDSPTPADLEQEKRIDHAFAAYATGPREKREELWQAFLTEHKKRSPAQVERMERERWLR